MEKFNEKKLSSFKNIPAQRQKRFQSKPVKIKSHIIFKGDPAFHQDSVQYIPKGRRTKIFQSENQNILPAQLLQNQQALLEHSSKLQVQQQINENIIDNFSRQMDPSDHNIYGDRIRNLKKRLTSQQLELYFEPNNLQSDINFGLMNQNPDQMNLAIHSSKASQTTQKKGQIYMNNTNQLRSAQVMISAISSNTQPAGQVVNFSYQGQKFQKQNEQIIESRVKKVTTVQKKSPQKSNTKTIFVNEGGVLVPKKSKKIEMQNSDYFDFDVHNNEHNERNESLINELRLTDTPQFNMMNGKSSEIINNFINQDYIKLDSEKNLDRYRKSMSDGNKIVIKGTNSPTRLNNVNSSNVSYKSIQKHFQNQTQSIPQQKSTNTQQALLNQLFENQMEDKSKKKNTNEDSMSFHHEDGASLFDKILKERQTIFNKNKQPEIEFKRMSQKKGSMIKIDGSYTNINETNSVLRPNDFITDSKFAPAGHKRSININTVPILPPQQHKKQQLQNKILSAGSPILQSKVKRIQLKTETLDNKNIQAPSKEQINQVQYKKVTKKNTKNKNVPIRNSNQSIPQSVGNEDDEDQYQIDYQNQDQEDFIEEQPSSSQQSSIEEKKAKLSKAKRKNSKQIKKKLETEDQLQDYLKQEQQKIHLKQIKKIMDHVPQIRDNLKKKSKKNKNQKTEIPKEQVRKLSDLSEGQQPVVYTAPNQLNPLQRQLLETVGIKLIEDAIGKNSQNQQFQPNIPMSNQYNNQINGQLNNQNWSQAPPNNSQMQQQFQQNLPLFFTHHKQILQKQNMTQQKGLNQNKNINPNAVGASINQYNQPIVNYEKQYEQITRMLYNQLKKIITALPPNSTKTSYQNGLTFPHNSIKQGSNQEIEIGSAFSFKNHKPLIQQKHPQINVYQPKNQFQKKNKIQTKFSSKQRQDLYNKQIYDELKKFNTAKDNIKRSRQKSRITFDEQQNDDSQYYSFYHDDQESKQKYKPSTFYNTQSYYPVKKQKTTKIKQMPSQKSLRSRFELKSNSQFGLLYQKIQQLTKQIHQQLPLIRKQIQQNQQQIRKIQTNLLVKNTAQQHTLIKILQKMKLKDLQLQQKQIQTKNKDHQLSMYQNQLASIKTQYIGNTNEMMQNLQMQSFFQNRLYKIKNYNENLYIKLSEKKSSPQSFIIPQRQSPILPIQRNTKIIPQRYSKILPQKYYHFI